jgi:hypothetical protein
MARERGRRSFSLSDEAQAILDQVDNYSGYVDALIKQHAHDWTEALARLVDAGWHPEELLSACEVLAGYSFGQWSRGGRFVAEELGRAQERERVFSSRDVPASRRVKLLKQLAADNTLATALAIVVREFHMPNSACREAVRDPRTASE